MKSPLNKQAVADCLLMPRAPAQVTTSVQGSGAGVGPITQLWSASSLYIFGYRLTAALTEAAFLLQNTSHPSFCLSVTPSLLKIGRREIFLNQVLWNSTRRFPPVLTAPPVPPWLR